jgi:hypothetical protein
MVNDVPWVVIDGEHKQGWNQNMPLKRVVCDLLQAKGTQTERGLCAIG